MRKTEEFKVLGIITLTLILLLAFDAIAGYMYPSLTSITDVSIIAWGPGVFAYIATYMIGIRGV